MSNITLIGFTTPFKPNSGQARFDTDSCPELGGNPLVLLSIIVPPIIVRPVKRAPKMNRGVN
jgi:hypothetical protein